MGRPVRAAKPYAIVHLVNRRSQLANHGFNEHHLILPSTYIYSMCLQTIAVTKVYHIALQ